MVSCAEPEYGEMHLALIGHVVLTSLLQRPAASLRILRDQQEILERTSRTHAAAIRGNGSHTTAHGPAHPHAPLALQVRGVMAHFCGSLDNES